MKNPNEKIVKTEFTTKGWTFISCAIICIKYFLYLIPINEPSERWHIWLLITAISCIVCAIHNRRVVSTSVGTKEDIAFVKKRYNLYYIGSQYQMDYFGYSIKDKRVCCILDENNSYFMHVISYEKDKSPLNYL